jgi:small-conductance mechanosensitive channel
MSRRARTGWLAVCVAVALTAPALAQDPTPPPTAAQRPIPLPEIASRSDDLAVYLKQLTTRLAPGQDIQAIDEQLPLMSGRVRILRVRTAAALAASPSLREVDELTWQWESFQAALGDWATALTDRVTVLEQEMGGLAELRAIWLATRDEAQAAGAPPAVADRIKATLALLQQARGQVESYRQTLLVLQDRVVREAALCRDAVEHLAAYRTGAISHLLERDSPPVWAQSWNGDDWDEASASWWADLREGMPVLREYMRAQLPRLPLQLTVFALLLWLWWQARQRTKGWLVEDDSLASVAAVFEHPLSSAVFLTLLLTSWIYPQPPLLLRQAVRIAATPPLLRVLDRLVDRPILPGLYALGAFFAVDQVRNLLAGLPLVDQVLFLLEVLTGVLLLAWMLRSGRIRSLGANLSPRTVLLLERAAQVLLVLLAFTLVAGALGFMQLARVVAGAMLGSGYLAMLLFAVQRFAQGAWAFLLRTRTLRRAHLVQHHHALLQALGDRLLGWTATALWAVGTLASAGAFDPVRDALRGFLTAAFTVGTFSLSLGDVIAFAVTVWLSFLISRFARFVLAEDVYPRVRLGRGLPYAFSTILHYTVLLVGFLVALAAAGINLDRFALLAGAFGVGIGFGLQNVVNNFVSGLILLFERPVQVGDTVQIGQLSGEICRIGIRSSTLRTGEGAEVIVPNGNLIADPVTNWTLSDSMRRIDLAVGVAYGNDPERVIDTLRGVAGAHPMVVETPGPVALFVGFGEKTLNFELRAWTDRFGQWPMIRSELAIAITKAFPAAGISLPFQPRDAPADAGPPPEVRVVGAAPTANASDCKASTEDTKR